MPLATFLAMFFSILMPSKQWYAPAEPLSVKIDAKEAVQLVLLEFQGGRVETEVPTTVEPGQTIDVRVMFPAMRVGTYILYAVPPGKPTAEFVGTPLVISMRGDGRPGLANKVAVIKVEPLSVAKLTTSAGEMQAILYYDVAPTTVDNFISLARGGFYDGLTFHRVVPDFIVQTGDPVGDNSGGPGYTIEPEFNGRQHLRGTLSMARESDPMEAQGSLPRPEFARTAGSQFFICLSYEKTKRLDGRYTAFGRLVGGEETLTTIGSGTVADASTGRPEQPVKISRIEIVPVTPSDNPYLGFFVRVEEVR
jgi:cyclophilin family peptidyl-prolyl cis-trans isomerase